MEIPVIKDLDFSLVKPGTQARFWVHVVSSGMAQPILVPLLISRGKKDGPILGMTAAVHGNELNGLSVIQKVFKDVDVEKIQAHIEDGILYIAFPKSERIQPKKINVTGSEDLNWENLLDK